MGDITDEIFNHERLAEGRYCTGNLGPKDNEDMTGLSSSSGSGRGARAAVGSDCLARATVG